MGDNFGDFKFRGLCISHSEEQLVGLILKFHGKMQGESFISENSSSSLSDRRPHRVINSHISLQEAEVLKGVGQKQASWD
jgi:hypothetical protein